MKITRLSLPPNPDPRRDLRDRWRAFLGGVLARDENGPRYRSQALTAFFILAWGLAMLVERPTPDAAFMDSLTRGQPALLAALLRLFATVGWAMISPQVLRHLLAPALMLYLSLRDGAKYLDDLFELKDEAAAHNHLSLAMFGGPYPVLEIKDGAVTPASQQTTAYRIGGPGYVKVHLGNAALFERVDGSADIYGATSAQFLHGFETLREVADLRDQIRLRTDMEVYTKDGLSVKAVDLQVLFRVWSAGRRRSQTEPYPFEPQALRRVVYGRAVTATGLAAPWTETVAEMASAAVTRYIGSRSLKQLIAQKERQGMAAAPERGATGSKPLPAENRPPNARQNLSLSMYSEGAAEEFEQAGVELLWIGVGTLDTPDEVEQELIDAWLEDLKARQKSGRYKVDDDRRKARAQILEKFITELAEGWRRFTATQATLSLQRLNALETGAFRAAPEDEVKLLTLFHLKLTELRDALGGRAAPDEAVARGLAYLSDATRILLGGAGADEELAEPEAGPLPAAPLAEAVFEKLDLGDRFLWQGLTVRVTQVLREGAAAGVVLERGDGQPFPAQSALPASRQHFLTRTDFEGLLRAGELTPLPRSEPAPTPLRSEPPAPAAPNFDAGSLAEGRVLWWSTVRGQVRIAEVVRDGARGVFVERVNGRDFTMQGNQPSGPRRFIPLQEVQRQLDSGDLRPE